MPGSGGTTWPLRRGPTGSGHGPTRNPAAAEARRISRPARCDDQAGDTARGVPGNGNGGGRCRPGLRMPSVQAVCRSHLVGVVPREQVFDPALPVAMDDGREGLGLPDCRVFGVHLAGIDRRGDDGPVFRSGIPACEESVPSGPGDGSDGAFHGVAVDLDATVGREAAKAVAVSGDAGQGLAQGRFGGGARGHVVRMATSPDPRNPNPGRIARQRVTTVCPRRPPAGRSRTRSCRHGA